MSFGLACATPSGYRQTVSTFHAAAVETAGLAGTYFREMNRVERDYYIESLKHDPTARFDYKQFTREEFTPESIKVRLDLLNDLVGYSELLAALAGNDAHAPWTEL